MEQPIRTRSRHLIDHLLSNARITLRKIKKKQVPEWQLNNQKELIEELEYIKLKLSK